MLHKRIVVLLTYLLLSVGLFSAAPKDEFRKSRVGFLAEKAPDAVDLGVDNGRQAQHFAINLKWDEAAYKFKVFVENDHPSDLEILGVQASLGLYIANVPTKIPAKGKAKITLIWVGSHGVPAGTEFLKVLTPVGEKTIEIEAQQEKRVDFDTHELVWKKGESSKTQTVTIKCSDPVKIVSVRAAGLGNTAVLKEDSPGLYRIEVTPGPVQELTSFPVTIEFSSNLIGVGSVIQCVVRD